MDARAETSEQRRLAALEATALLDTPTERVFDRLTEVAAATLGVPIALISLVTDDRQFFKRQCGLPKPVADDRETPLAHSFCQHVVQDRAPLVIEDAREDARLHDNLAIRDLGVSAYAGVPLMLPDGAVIGSFCAIDTSPHRFDESDIAVLKRLAETTIEIVGLRAEAVEGMDVSRRLQAALVPEPPPIDRGQLAALYRPGERRLLLGGDFYLVAETANGEVSLLIGDVAGHGPEAAAFAATLRSAWRTMPLAPASLDVIGRPPERHRPRPATRPAAVRHRARVLDRCRTRSDRDLQRRPPTTRADRPDLRDPRSRAPARPTARRVRRRALADHARGAGSRPIGPRLHRRAGRRPRSSRHRRPTRDRPAPRAAPPDKPGDSTSSRGSPITPNAQTVHHSRAMSPHCSSRPEGGRYAERRRRSASIVPFGQEAAMPVRPAAAGALVMSCRAPSRATR